MATREGYTELRNKVLEARRVWKRTLFWTGCAIVLVGLIAIIAGETLVDLLMPLPSMVRAVFLIGVVGGLGYLLYKHLIRPLRADLTLHDVALNVEQKHPELEDRLVSALQFGERESDDPIEAHMLQRLVDDAAERTKELDFKATVDRRRKRKHVGIAFATVAFCGLLALIFPAAIHTALNRVFVPWEKTDPILTTKLTVQPGAARILRGQSIPINVEVTGRAADKVTLVYTKSEDSFEAEQQEQQISMVPIEGRKGKFGYEIFNINENMKYYVVANDTESERYTVEVFDMPKITGIEVAYNYPEYTQLKPIVQQGEGNIRAIVGSQAEVRLTMNKAIQSASLTVAGKPAVSMVISEGVTLTSTLDVLKDGKYNVELLCVDGFKNQTPIEYLITVLPDDPPEVVIKEPGRDIDATKLEEVNITAEATDDYGIEKLVLKYSIGSGEFQELPMETPGLQERKIINGSYAFYLEEIDVEPGEVISYYAEAVDNNTRTGPGVATSQIYFIEVRPFNERYVEEEGEPAPPVPPICGKLIGTEKQVIRETWKHTNAKPAPLTEDYKFAVKKTAEKQSKLKDSAQEFVDQISGLMRSAAVDPEIVMNLEDAIAEMGTASDELYAIKPKQAMPHEQDALGLIVKVCQEMPKVLTRMRQSGQQQVADNIEMELEDLESTIEEDQNELDEQMREQTQEMLDQAQQMLAQQQQLTQQSQQMGREQQPSQQEMQQNSQQQQQLAQGAQQMGQQLGQMGQGATGQGGTGQRMGQAGQAMQDASEQMQQAAKGMQQQNPQMSAAKGQKAEENLQQAIDELEKVASQFSDEALEQATEELDRLIAEQSEVKQETGSLRERAQQDGMRPEDQRQASELANQQRELARDTEQLQQDLSNLQDLLNQNNPQAARNVRDAARRMIEEQVPENMSSAQRGLQWRSFRSAEQDQQEALEVLQAARDDLQQARANMAETEEEQLETALEQLERFEDQMQDIQRELEAMENQETPLTPEQEARQQQLSELQEQMQQRMQAAQQAMQGQQPGQGQGQQPGQQPGQGQQGDGTDQQVRVGTDSDRRIEKLWMGLLNSVRPNNSRRKNAPPNYDLVLRELGKLKEALEDRLTEIQEAKRLAQVLKEDVPPEYRQLVERYYESLAK